MLSRNLKSMLSRRGQPATLRKVAYGTYDPTTGTTSGTNTDYTVQCYFAEYSNTEINNDSILMGDRRVLVSPVDIYGDAIPEPDEEDSIIGVGDPAIIRAVHKIYNRTTLVCYICQVRD